jgi:hypothetical protein
MDLGPALKTSGVYDPARGLARLGLPERLDGLTVLDVGAWDGFYSFSVPSLTEYVGPLDRVRVAISARRAGRDGFLGRLRRHRAVFHAQK